MCQFMSHEGNTYENFSNSTLLLRFNSRRYCCAVTHIRDLMDFKIWLVYSQEDCRTHIDMSLSLESVENYRCFANLTQLIEHFRRMTKVLSYLICYINKRLVYILLHLIGFHLQWILRLILFYSGNLSLKLQDSGTEWKIISLGQSAYQLYQRYPYIYCESPAPPTPTSLSVHPY